KADVSSNDLLEWWEDDDATDLVLLYLESFGNPRTFSHIARRVSRRKPILALKAGVTSAGARAASSHTAALAGSDAAVDALFRQAGVLRARTLEELVDAAALLSSQPLPAGPRVGVITNAGGLGILCADACEAHGLELPQLTDANVDALIVLFVPPVVAGADEVAAAIVATVARQPRTKPVIGVVVSEEGTPEILRAPGAPVVPLAYPESAARALALALERTRWLERPQGSQPRLTGVDRGAAEQLTGGGDRWLTPTETRALLDAYGIPLVPERVAATADEAVAASRELGFPAVVKTAAAG